MGLFPHEHETIAGVGRALREGKQSCEDVLERCLDRIEEWEPRLKAWVLVDREGALIQARALDEELASGRWRGPLHGIPIGIKDIIDVAGLPTAAGFAPWAGRIAKRDARIVASLRSAGAVLLGKTVTTQFAWIDPPPTRNPWDLERTPGGSSSGSAVALAVGMCLGAIGTQTGGSIIRPAAFCGVAGLKPRYRGQFDGILEFAPHLDHPGPLSRCTLDLGLMFREMDRHDSAIEVGPLSPVAVESRAPESSRSRMRPPRLGKLRGFFEARADAEMWDAYEHATRVLENAGAHVTDLSDPFDFQEVLRNHRVIMCYEAAIGHRATFAEFADSYAPRIRSLIEEGLRIPSEEYQRCRQDQERLRTLNRTRESEWDAIVMPATVGAAPDPSTTGDPAFNAAWSYTGDPTVTFPMGLSRQGLPMGIQLVGDGAVDEFVLIETARWCEDVVRRSSRPSEVQP